MAFNDYNEWSRNVRLYASSTKYPDTGIRYTPDAVDLPEQIGITLTSDVEGLATLTFLQRTTGLNQWDIENQGELVNVSLPFLTDVGANFKIANNAALTGLQAPNLRLPLFGTSVTGASINFSGNALNAVDVDNLFNRLALSLSSGVAYYCVINTSGGTSAAPTSASSLARSSLYLGKTSYHITVSTN